MRLQTRIAVITGTTSGIGRHIAMTCVRNGAKLAVADRSGQTAEAAAAAIGAASGQAKGIAMAGQHSGLTDLPLTSTGEANAPAGAATAGPVVRARAVQRDARLMEWDHGDHQGRTSAAVQARRRGWRLFRDGCRGGETTAQVVARAASLIATPRSSVAAARPLHRTDCRTSGA